MIRLILVTLLTFLGFVDNGPKYDLYPKPSKEKHFENLRVWIQMNFDFIALVVVILSIVFFVWFCFFITGISATDSGMMYNNFDKVI
ncbi:MAG: hypothetical protein IJ743_04510 [Bacilli bacterium]|nr:hypothetical protein [Bacilli bacterium]